MSASISLEDLPREVRERLGLESREKKRRGMTLDEVRSHALRCLQPLAGLTQRERRRVLVQAGKVNDV